VETCGGFFLEKIRQSSIHFQERPGKTLDFRVVLGYYGYIVVESGVKNPFSELLFSHHFVPQNGFFTPLSTTM
jgi:hypothetical protein